RGQFDLTLPLRSVRDRSAWRSVCIFRGTSAFLFVRFGSDITERAAASSGCGRVDEGVAVVQAEVGVRAQQRGVVGDPRRVVQRRRSLPGSRAVAGGFLVAV